MNKVHNLVTEYGKSHKLTPGERVVLINFVCTVPTMEQQARKLDVSIETVRTFRKRILKKTDLQSMAQVVSDILIFALRRTA